MHTRVNSLGSSPSAPNGGRYRLVQALSFVLLVACTQSTRDLPTGEGPAPELDIVAVQTAGPLVVGSLLSVEARGLELLDDEVSLDVRSLDGSRAVSLIADRIRTTTEVEFRVSSAIMSVFGVGAHDLSMTLLEGERRSEPSVASVELTDSIALRLDDVPSGSVFRNEEAVLTGTGFVDPEEATLEVELQGNFEDDQGGFDTVSVRLPIVAAERLARDRGVVRLSTAIGGLRPGTFTGTLQVFAAYPGGPILTSAILDTQLVFLEPMLFEVVPTDPVLGQIVTFRGGGFLGSEQEPDEATIVRFEGTVTNDEGITLPFGPSEVVALYQSGSRAQWGLEVEQRGLSLISRFFGAQRGTFRGTVTVVTIKGTDEIEGEPTPVVLTLSGVRQVVVVSLLPGFFDSLRHYGLSLAALELRDALHQRMVDIYAPYAVDILLDEPTDFLATAISHLEIGGPDPNGLGLLGYDNTPGKDVGNLRLSDTIGGENAQTLDDGLPGYGGVFIESFLYWSEDPGLPGERPLGSPPADPLFDEIFGPVRAVPATLDEAEGQGDPARVRVVERAVNALGAMIGETAAHEVGHSLGLAQPFGPENAYHSAAPDDGCIMDAGADRPLGERAAQAGYAQTRFCADEPEYLLEIMGP